LVHKIQTIVAIAVTPQTARKIRRTRGGLLSLAGLARRTRAVDGNATTVWSSSVPSFRAYPFTEAFDQRAETGT
jgi:hypothetical protein